LLPPVQTQVKGSEKVEFVLVEVEDESERKQNA
jgi:hypothetical protein